VNDDISTGFLAGAGDSLNLLLYLILGLMLLGWMGHWWFWVFVAWTTRVYAAIPNTPFSTREVILLHDSAADAPWS